MTLRGQPESDSKMTQKWLKSDFFRSHVTQKWLLSHFCVIFESLSGWPRKVTFESFLIRKSGMPIKFPPVILGRETAAPILWAPGIFWFSLLENPRAHKILPFRGGFWASSEGGVELPILFLWARGFFWDLVLVNFWLFWLANVWLFWG